MDLKKKEENNNVTTQIGKLVYRRMKIRWKMWSKSTQTMCGEEKILNSLEN